MEHKKLKQISRFLSLVLRHKPQVIDLSLNANGWAEVSDLLEKMRHNGKHLTLAQLEEIVATNDKKRFAFNDDRAKIRASQGHSLKTVELELEPQEPPVVLYHGTVQKFMSQIKKQGLKKMSRRHVHLSQDKETAVKVGSRRGVPIILTVRSSAMHEAGFQFFLSANGVWLTDEIPSAYI